MTDQQSDRARLNNVFVDVSVEVGRTEIRLGDARRIKAGDVIDLNTLCGEAFDILLNQRPFAKGETVVVYDLMAIRITRLIDRKHEAPS